VTRQGESRTERELHSERVTADNAVELPLKVASRGLTRVALMAGTFHQRRLEQEVTVEILDADREVLARQRVQGADVRNNSWFTVDFPAIEKKTELYVRVSTREPARSKSFILWLDPAGDLCVQSFYRVEPESMAAQ